LYIKCISLIIKIYPKQNFRPPIQAFSNTFDLIYIERLYIKLQRLRWMGQLQPMGGARNTKKMCQANKHNNDPKRDPRRVKKGIRQMGINW